MKSIEEAQLHLATNANKGTKCPCCNQFVKLYKRKLNNSHANYLLEFARIANDDTTKSFHIKELIAHSPIIAKTYSGEFARLRHYGLIEDQKEGQWTLTKKALGFIEGKLAVPEYVKIYNNKVLGFSLEQVKISDIIKKSFDKQELLRA